VDELEEGVRNGIQAALDRSALVRLQVQQPRAEDEGDHQHLQQFALGESPDEVVREDIEDEVYRRVRLPRRHRRLHTGGGGSGRHSLTCAQQIAGDQPECQRDGGNDLEVEHRDQADLADPLEVAGRDDADRDAQEHQRGDSRLDQAQEDIAQYFELRREGGKEEADRGTEHHGEDDLEAQAFP
jgi:hypothetical protein